MHELKIAAHLPREQVHRIRSALSVESNREIPRTKVEISGEEYLEIRILAEDLHALRAALNSYMRWLKLAIEVEEVIEDGS